MQIFYLDKDVRECARSHSDKSVVKQVLECTQLLSSALSFYGHPNPPYKPTHLKHPDSLYIQKSRANYIYVCKLLDALLYEYTDRYGKIHACQKYLNFFMMNSGYIPDGKFEDPPLCMPDKYKCDDHVQSYRNYYIAEKAYYCKWRNGNIPLWFTQGMIQQ